MKNKIHIQLISYLVVSVFLFACTPEQDMKKDDNQKGEFGSHVTIQSFDLTKVKMKEVDSSAIAYIGYMNEKLVIVFNASLDRCYVYSDVAYDDYIDLINAESIGGYYNKHIKNVYDEALRIDGIEVYNEHIRYK